MAGHSARCDPARRIEQGAAAGAYLRASGLCLLLLARRFRQLVPCRHWSTIIWRRAIGQLGGMPGSTACERRRNFWKATVEPAFRFEVRAGLPFAQDPETLPGS